MRPQRNVAVLIYTGVNQALCVTGKGTCPELTPACNLSAETASKYLPAFTRVSLILLSPSKSWTKGLFATESASDFLSFF